MGQVDRIAANGTEDLGGSKVVEQAKQARPTARLSAALKRQDWIAVGIELLVVIIGVLVALEVNQWAEQRETRSLEHSYLLRLKEDLQLERDEADRFSTVANDRLAAVILLDRLARNPSTPVKDPRTVVCALATVSWGSFPPVHNISYQELQNTGRTSLIRSVSLRRSLAEHYATLADFARPADDRTGQDRFESKAAGILSASETMAIERADGDCKRMEPVSAGRERVIAAEWASRRTAIDELAGLAEHNEFNLRVLEGMRARIDSLLASIDIEISK
jgi:hypothetical protein